MHLRLEQAVELLDGQKLVAQPAVERLHVRVLPWRTGLDVAAGGAREPAPVAQGVGRELGPVVTADVAGRCPPPGDDPVERGGGGVGVDAPGGHHRQRLARVLVDDVEQLQDPPVRGLVELGVQRPDVVRPLSTRGLTGHRPVTSGSVELVRKLLTISQLDQTTALMSDSLQSHARLLSGDREMPSYAASYPCASPGNSRCSAPRAPSPSGAGCAFWNPVPDTARRARHPRAVTVVQGRCARPSPRPRATPALPTHRLLGEHREASAECSLVWLVPGLPGGCGHATKRPLELASGALREARLWHPLPHLWHASPVPTRPGARLRRWRARVARRYRQSSARPIGKERGEEHPGPLRC